MDEAALFDFRGAFGGRIFRAGLYENTKTNEGEPGDDDTEEDGPPAPSVISRGNNVPEGMEEWRARVEYAPYQKTPRGKTHRDKREGTIERDASYVKFVKDLEAQMEGPPVAPMSAEQALERREAAVPEVLGEHVLAERGAFRVRARCEQSLHNGFLALICGDVQRGHALGVVFFVDFRTLFDQPLHRADVAIPCGVAASGASLSELLIGGAAILAGASQLIPPAYSLLKKPKNVPGYAPQAYASSPLSGKVAIPTQI